MDSRTGVRDADHPVRGKDYEYAGPRDVFGGTVTLHAGGAHEAHLLVPNVPAVG